MFRGMGVNHTDSVVNDEHHFHVFLTFTGGSIVHSSHPRLDTIWYFAPNDFPSVFVIKL